MDNNLNNKITNIFNALVINIDPSILLNKDDQAIVYYTLYGEVELINTTIIVLELANRVYSHAVTTINTIIDIFPTDINLFAYNITLYYTSIKFIGIIIDIKASKYFIVGYSQFFILQKMNKIQSNKSIRGTVSVQFKIGFISSISSIKMAILIGILYLL